MKLQKIGGFVSLGHEILLLIFLVFQLLVFPRLGLLRPSDWFDPAKSFDAMNASPMAFFIFKLDFILLSIATILVVLALRERMQAAAPNLMRIAVIATSIACALWLATGLIGTAGTPSIRIARDASAFRAVMAMLFGLGITADFAWGWALLLIGWAALTTRGLPRILSYFFVLRGVLMILEFAGQPLMVIALLLGLVFWPWLGIVLLRSKS